MEISGYSEVSESKRVFEITVPPDELAAARRSITDRLARKLSLPGFRKGHVPEQVIEKRFAAEIREELIEKVVPEALGRAIREKGVQPVGNPRIADLKFEDGQPLAFRADVDVRPPVDPGDYRGIEVVDASVEPLPEEIEEPLQHLRHTKAEFLPIEERAAGDGDFAIADIGYRDVESAAPVLFSASGEAISGESGAEWHRDEKVMLEVGHADNMAEINDALRGISPGQTRAFRKAFPADFPNARFAGKTVEYEVTAVALKERRLPELSDAFVKDTTSAATVDELKERIVAGVRSEKEAARKRLWRRRILETLSARVTAPPPENLVEAEVEGMLEALASQLAARGVDPKGQNWDKLASEARPAAAGRVREYLVLDEIARRENIPVSDTEVDAEIRRAAGERGTDFGALKKRLEREGRLSRLAEEIRLQKTAEWLVGQARVVAKPPA